MADMKDAVTYGHGFGTVNGLIGRIDQFNTYDEGKSQITIVEDTPEDEYLEAMMLGEWEVNEDFTESRYNGKIYNLKEKTHTSDWKRYTWESTTQFGIEVLRPQHLVGVVDGKTS